MSLDIGVWGSVGTAVPPGADEQVNAAAVLTTGMRFTVGPPENDALGRSLRGARCLDVTLAPYVKVGAEVVIPLLPDVSVDIADFDGPAATLYEGPCWGYSGTVTTKVDITRGQYEQGCTAQYCDLGGTLQETITKSLTGQPASYTRFPDPTCGGACGSPIAQPYSWSATRTTSDSWTTNTSADGTGSEVVCSSTSTATGSGTVTWAPGDIAWAWFLGSWESDNGLAVSSIPGGAIDVTTVIQGDPGYCGAGGTASQPVDGFWTYQTTTIPLLQAATINLVLDGHDDTTPSHTWTTTAKLTRADYPRG